MVDLNELSLQQCLCLLKEKEGISNTLNLGAFLKTRLKKCLLTFATTLGLLNAFGSVGCAEMDYYAWPQIDRPLPLPLPLREDYVGKQKLSEKEYYDYINNAHLDSQCGCVPTHIQWQTYNNDLLSTCKLYLKARKDGLNCRWSEGYRTDMVLSTLLVFGAGLFLIAWCSVPYLHEEEEEGEDVAFWLFRRTFHHYSF